MKISPQTRRNLTIWALSYTLFTNPAFGGEPAHHVCRGILGYGSVGTWCKFTPYNSQQKTQSYKELLKGCLLRTYCYAFVDGMERKGRFVITYVHKAVPEYPLLAMRE
jgi:hypothetical protein